MRQHARFKAAHPECLLLFRMGDFYEMFDEDAVRASKAIGLTLTQRAAGLPMAGVPYHQLDTYLRKLLAAGFRVAICDQVQDPAHAKGLVERAVTRVCTPGTLVEETLLEEGRPQGLGAVAFLEGSGGTGVEPGATAAVAVVDLSTGGFTAFWCTPSALGDELARRAVREVLYAGTGNDEPPARLTAALARAGMGGLAAAPTAQPAWHFRLSEAREALCQQFGVSTLAGFGFGDEDALAIPAGVIVRYLRATQAPAETQAGEGAPAIAGAIRMGSARSRTLGHLRPPRKEESGAWLTLDAAALRALEVETTMRGGTGTEGSLLGLFMATGSGEGRGGCKTAMGRRLVREWLCRPSRRMEEIRGRHRAVAALVSDRRMAGEVGAALGGVQDVARIGARVALGRASPRDVVALGASLSKREAVAAALLGVSSLSGHRARLEALHESLGPLAGRIMSACVEAAPAHLREGGLVKDGFDAALDEARLLERDAGSWLAQYQKQLIDEHELPNLKVGYNKIFGYFIELPKGQSGRAPAVFSRRQTLTNAERYITPELRTFEEKVSRARERAIEREQLIFDELCRAAEGCLGALWAYSEALGEVDALLCFADRAAQRRWCEPEMVEEPELAIVQGRHPVLEELLGDRFVPNDSMLGTGEAAGLALITGPNMAGKSTFIRQTALLVLLAHAGSFVPAASARIGLCDRIFTRVGADDALHAGQSTFMVEMTETAGILHHATGRSLVVLDEIGRGTSTLDGLSLAWSIAETLAGGAGGAGASGGEKGPRTLFATHYHELTRLEELLPGAVANLHVAVREWTGEGGQSEIVFLHRIVPGRTDRSYGIHVARLAGLPPATVARARAILETLSVEHGAVGVSGGQGAGGNGGSIAAGAGRVKSARDEGQLALFREFVPHPAVDALREVKIEALSPMEAFDQLRRLKGMADG